MFALCFQMVQTNIHKQTDRMVKTNGAKSKQLVRLVREFTVIIYYN